MKTEILRFLLSTISPGGGWIIDKNLVDITFAHNDGALVVGKYIDKKPLEIYHGKWNVEFHVLTKKGSIECWSAGGEEFPLQVLFFKREVKESEGAVRFGGSSE